MNPLSEGSLYWRDLGDGWAVSVWPMTFGKARLCYGSSDMPTFERGFCYEWPGLAIAAALAWSGEGDPLVGWHRDINTGRRREGGDPSKETRYY